MNKHLDKSIYLCGKVGACSLLSPELHVIIDTKLGATKREKLINFVEVNSDVFELSHEDMSGIDPMVMVHRLHRPMVPTCLAKKRLVNRDMRDVIF